MEHHTFTLPKKFHMQILLCKRKYGRKIRKNLHFTHSLEIHTDRLMLISSLLPFDGFG